MDNLKAPAASNKRIRRHRLVKAAGYALVRGAAYATGSGIVGLVVWWLTNRR